MATFEEFITSIQADGNDGKAFEYFCKWFLLNDPYWKTQVDKAWLFSEWPDRWGPDNGIDLIFKHKNGETWAVQAKCYDNKYAVSKTDMDSFLTESNRALIQHRLLLASTNIVGRNAQRACAGQEKPVTLYLRKDFETAQVEYPSHISVLTSAKPKSKPVPDPHQIRAIDEVVSKFEGFDRGQLIMACGTGKTFTSLWIKEALGAQTTLVLVPSLNLLSQTLNEWVFAAKHKFDVLCVCSDKTVGKRENEDMALGEAPFSVTSNLSIISNFISNDGPKVIFCTYNSSDLISEVQSDKAIDPFDLVIADEAHRCCGKSDTAFSKVLDGAVIRANKRLFTTATPRLYSRSVKKAAADRGIEVYGMDDEAVFGPVLHTLTFGEAISEDLLNDYQVVIVGVDQPMIKEWIENQELIGVNPNNVTDARTLAAKIGLLKAIKDFRLTRVISFHSRVNAARDFAAEVSELVDLIDPSNRPKGTLWSSYVSGAMRTKDRINEIGRLKNLESADIGVLANAKCLSEGVDVPSLNGIAFIDPRGSQVDIIQAVGRAIRKVRNASTQTKGTIVLPVFIEDGDDVESQIEASNFKPVWDVLKALRSHDEVLADHLDRYRANMARNSNNAHQALDGRIIFDVPTTIDSRFSLALRTVLVEATTESWTFYFQLFKSYFKEFKKGYLGAEYVTVDGYRLGTWVMSQRQQKKNGTLSTWRMEKLNSTNGWFWTDEEARWEKFTVKLKSHIQKFNSTGIHQDFCDEDGYPLGQQISQYRIKYKNKSIKKYQIKFLEGIPDWVWNAEISKWMDNFNLIKEFYNKHGTPYTSFDYEVKVGKKLRTWLFRQKRIKDLSDEKLKLLATIEADRTKEEILWLGGYKILQKYSQQTSNAQVPQSFRTDSGFGLGTWVRKQRSKKNKLSDWQIQKLEHLPKWSWDPFDDRWNQNYNELLAFYNKHKHTRVPRKDNHKLSSWCTTQRHRFAAEQLEERYVDFLEKIPGWSWDALDDKWWDQYEAVISYYNKYSRLPPTYFRTDEGYDLYSWIRFNLKIIADLVEERRKAMKKIKLLAVDL